MTRSRRAPIAVTMGEPAGIGGEVTLMAWRRRTANDAPFVLLDDPERVAELARRIGVDVPVEQVADMAAGARAFSTALPVLPVRAGMRVAPGVPDRGAAGAVIESIDRAVRLAMNGEAMAVVTNPIHKETLYEAGFAHPGHTEYLGQLAGLTHPPVMMLACDALRVVPVTVHMSLRDAVAALSTDAIVHCGVLAAASLAADFGLSDPVVAVAGLNPHAGEQGHLGDEEQRIIGPAIDRLRSMGHTVTGPFPADTLFHDEARRGYDAVLCMYHDQALIPLKTLDFHGGVNVTLGLPFVRTSPDHGTAFDIAGTGRANPTSMVNALGLAAAMARRRGAPTGRVALA